MLVKQETESNIRAFVHFYPKYFILGKQLN